jgi:hypothetical protein
MFGLNSENMDAAVERYFPEFGHPLLVAYLIGNTSIAGLSIIYRKLTELTAPEERFVLAAQIIARFAMAQHGWAEPIRNLQGFTSSLILAVKEGRFEPDEWALDVMALVDENKPPRFEDCPERIARRKLAGIYVEPEPYHVKFEKWKQGKEWF